MALKIKIKETEIRVGDTITLTQEIEEGDKKRLQAYTGIVIKIKGGENATFVVRKVSGAHGMEKTYPVDLPSIKKIKVLKHSRVRRAKLYYLRDRVGKKATRLKVGSKVKVLPQSAETSESVSQKDSSKDKKVPVEAESK